MSRPSTADEMVMAGVIMPSANSADPPRIAGKTTHLPCFLTREYSESMPPSPLLSARKVTTTYLTVVCSVSVQNIHYSPPYIRLSLIVPWLTIALKTYKDRKSVV